MSAPVKHTCPDINRLIRKSNDAIKWLYDALKEDDLETVKNIINDAINEIEDIDGLAEDLRSDNQQLREWGEELEDEIEDLKAEINELKHPELT